MTKLREVVSSQQILDALASDGLSIAHYTVDHVATKIAEVVKAGGSYTVEANFKVGAVFTFYDKAGDLEDLIIINEPSSSGRRAPPQEWLAELLAPMRPVENKDELLRVHQLITDHVNNGGKWQSLVNTREIRIELLQGNSVTLTLTFYPETLSQFG